MDCACLTIWKTKIFACTALLCRTGVIENVLFYFRELIRNSQTSVEKVFLIETIKVKVPFHYETVRGYYCNLFMTNFLLTVFIRIKAINFELSPERRAADIQDLGHS